MKALKRLLDLLRNYISSLKWPFSASLLQNFSTVCTHMLSKFFNKSTRKWLIFPSQAKYARALFKKIYKRKDRGPRENRRTSAPFISGDTFRFFCQTHFDEVTPLFKPQRVKKNEAVFVSSKYLKQFFEIHHPKIKHPYVLVTHNYDAATPGEFVNYLDDPKLLAWFGINKDQIHPKFHSIPFGFANAHAPHGNQETIKEMIGLKVEKKNLLYMNFLLDTCIEERSIVYRKFENVSFCKRRERTDFKTYIQDLKETKFVLSPRGYGEDCIRTWESLVFGAIPIVRSSLLDPLFKDLPVLIIHSWDEITEEFLNEKWETMSKGTFNTDKLRAPYWLNQIAAKLKS